MRALLDTHALLWWLSDDERLGAGARAVIADPENAVLVSVVSLWEIVVKQRVGKLDADIVAIERAVGRGGFERISITGAHFGRLSTLPVYHRDPFDHLLIAQAMVEDAVLVSDDREIALYGVRMMRCRVGLD